MTADRDLGRLLDRWLADGFDEVNDRVLDAVEARIGVEPQRPGWRVSWRDATMNGSFKLAAGVAVAALIAIVTWQLLPDGPDIGGQPTPGPTATPIVTPTASASPGSATPAACDEGATTCAGRLVAGDGASTAFQPKLSFTVPNGWTNTFETRRAYRLLDMFTRAHFFQVYSEVAIPEQNATCTAARKAGAGNTVADWVEFFTTHPGLTTTEPQAIAIGGREGSQLDLHVAEDWTATCPNSLGPAVYLISNSGTPLDRVKWIDDQNVTVRLLDVDGETVIIYLESSPVEEDLAFLNTRFQPVIDSFEFTPGG